MPFRINKINNLYILFGLWAIVQIILFLINGIKLNGEAEKVINQATNLISSGKLESANFYMYATEILLTAVSLKFGIGYWYIILIHLWLNGFALFYLYKFLEECYKSQKLATIACTLLIFCYPYQEYNFYLYTESIFFSLSIIYSCFLLKTNQFTFKRSLAIALFLFLLCVTRPTGILIIASTIIYIFFKLTLFYKPVKRILIFICLSLTGLIILNIMLGTGGELDLMLPFKNEHILCGVPTLKQDANIKIIAGGNSVYGLFYYLTHNFSQFRRLALWRTEAFFGLARSFYSIKHNIFLIAFFYPIYAFIIIAIIKFTKKLPMEFIYFIATILSFWVCVILSCDEWSNRFFLTLTPFLIIPGLFLFSKKTTNFN